MCGEHKIPRLYISSNIGSSPHVRGAPIAGNKPNRGFRIIPACAGSTFYLQTLFFLEGDHPRMCGEHCSFRTSGQPIAGSSPHVRGALLLNRYAIDEVRIIPACAGSTD